MSINNIASKNIIEFRTAFVHEISLAQRRSSSRSSQTRQRVEYGQGGGFEA